MGGGGGGGRFGARLAEDTGLTLAILLTFMEQGVGGGGVSGLGAISSSGPKSGFSANMLSRSICGQGRGWGLYFITLTKSIRVRAREMRKRNDPPRSSILV